jgi:polyphosphate kinase
MSAPTPTFANDAPPLDLGHPDLYFNRELSRLAFNSRVLQQALDPAVPLLERLRFLTISCSNLDEFFEIRVSRLQQQVAFGLSARSPDGLAAAEILGRVSAEAHRLVAQQYQVLDSVLLPELSATGLRLVRSDDYEAHHLAFLREYFHREVVPVLTPIGLDPAHPFPHVQNKNLALIVSLDGTDAFGRRSGIAVVQVPRALPRVLRLPEPPARSAPTDVRGRDFTLLSTVIQRFVGELFPGMQVLGCAPFRLTRDSDLFVAEEETDDLLQAMKGELSRRNDGDAVRLEVGEACTPQMASFLLAQFELTEQDLYRVPGPVNLHRLAELVDLSERPDLRYPPHVPRTPKVLSGKGDLFTSLAKGPLVLHHPYDSAAPVLELVRQAAVDPDVLAIKQTLYRTGKHSPFAQALLDAARAGKDVTVVIELRARFDEAANIDLATALQDAGANVVYGVVGYKTHAKMMLIVRRESGQLRRYAHFGTGNYHPTTARLYTDVSLLTADPVLCEDAHQVFLQLTGLGSVRPTQKLLQAPFSLHAAILASIEAEAAAARLGRPARIVAKMNALTEPAIIQALYLASRAGVEIDLIVRGICCIRPGIAGVSDKIRVRSIVGRFLEHARVYWFGSTNQLLCGSADWMERNLQRRVEVVFPLEVERDTRRILAECLIGPLRDNVGAWTLQSDGSWLAPHQDSGHPAFSVQDALLRGEPV